MLGWVLVSDRQATTILTEGLAAGRLLLAASASAGRRPLRPLLAAVRSSLCPPPRPLPAVSVSAGRLLLRPLLEQEQDNTSLTVLVITPSPLGELFMPDRARFAPTPIVCTRVTAWRCHKSCAWGMNNSPSSSILEHSLVTIALCRPVVEAVQRKDRDLASWFFNHSSASQIRRAVSSVSLNLAEGFGASRGNSRLRFESALGSLYEARAGVRVALAWGFVTADAAQAVLQSMESLGGRVFGRPFCHRASQLFVERGDEVRFGAERGTPGTKAA